MLWYSGRSAPLAAGAAPSPDGAALGTIGLAVGGDGLRWRRGGGPVETMATGEAALPGSDAGAVLQPGDDWWAFDTAGVGQPDVQARRARARGWGGSRRAHLRSLRPRLPTHPLTRPN